VDGAGAALAINDEGEIVGEVTTAAVVGLGATKAVLWTEGDEGYEATSLGDGSARDINDGGLIVGAIPKVPLQSAATFAAGEAPTPLPPNSGFSSADRVNAGDVIIGSDNLEPVAWYDGTQYPLYDVLDEFDAAAEVRDVIDAYYTLGRITVSGRVLGFIQAPGGEIYPLSADATKASAATDLNSSGIAVGGAGEGLNGSYAALFVYGSVVPIELLLSAADQEDWELLPDVTALNDGVTMVGNGKKDGGATTGWLVRPPQ
jgi:hypothetical protein